jgi:GT2 family glycosyltransferase
MGQRVSVALITYDSAQYLRRCLDGIAQQRDVDLSLIVIDNASRDDSVAIVRAARGDATILRNDVNVGYSAAINQALRHVDAEFVLFLNPDVFLSAHYLSLTVEALRQAGESFGSATGKLLSGRGPDISPTGLIDSKGIRMTRSGRHFDIDAGLAEDAVESLPREVFGVSGAAAVHKATFLRDVAIGGETLDEDFFAYREDADLAWRGRLFGWRALYVPAAVAFHVRRVTPAVRRTLPPELNRHSVKNRFLLRLKNEGWRLALRNAPFEIFRDLIVLAAALTVERTSLPAFAWLWRERKRLLEKRRAVQSRRRVPDEELARWFR